jgi:uncharacterized protein YbbK (DUF523 family)/uncharacterized protein YbgA (DUF1722 family)
VPLDRKKVSLPVIRVGISSCLLGEQVRWDGGHKLDRILTDTMGRSVYYCPICPEKESGFGVPREPFHLVGDPRAPRLITSRTKQDHTERMLRWVRKMVRELETKNLYGFIFKSKSPSCGMERVRVYGVKEKGASTSTGQGLFARAFMEHFPLIPVEDDGHLHAPQHSANFIERCFVMKQWRDVVRQRRRSRGNLVRFHTEHDLLLRSHSPRHYKITEELVARAKAMPTAALFAEYQKLLREALRFQATPAKHRSVLQLIMGYFKKQLSSDAKRELDGLITAYRQGHVPLTVLITLINNYVRLYDQPFLRGQYYLHRHPLELQLRSHV